MGEDCERIKTITAAELKNNLGKYLDYVGENNEVIVTKNGENFVRMIRYQTDYTQYYSMQIKENALEYQYEDKRVSYEDFMDMYVNSNLRMEFINGEIIIMGSPSINHQITLGNMFIIFNSYLQEKQCKAIMAPFDVHFYKTGTKETDVCQPDLLIACDIEGNINERGRYMGTPSLVVEILSPSTRTIDMSVKLNTYMKSGVKEFWVIDPSKKTCLVYNFKDNEIDDLRIYKNEEIVESKTFEGLTADLEKVFE